jgi:hypothetical protein
VHVPKIARSVWAITIKETGRFRQGSVRREILEAKFEQNREHFEGF